MPWFYVTLQNATRHIITTSEGGSEWGGYVLILIAAAGMFAMALIHKDRR